MYLLQGWMLQQFDGTQIDALLVYILLFPLYWALLGFLVGLVYWVQAQMRNMTVMPWNAVLILLVSATSRGSSAPAQGAWICVPSHFDRRGAQNKASARRSHIKGSYLVERWLAG